MIHTMLLAVAVTLGAYQPDARDLGLYQPDELDRTPANEPPVDTAKPLPPPGVTDVSPAGGSCPSGQCPLTYTPTPQAKATTAESRPVVQYRRPLFSRFRRR